MALWWAALSVGSDDENRGCFFGELIKSDSSGLHTREVRQNLDFVAYSSVVPVCRP